MDNCTHNHNYGDILVEEAMITNMYDQDNMTRIMLDHKITKTFNLKYKMAMTIQELSECARELIGASSTSHRKSDYKAHQAEGQRGAIPKKLDQNSKGKCNECKKSFENMITVRGKPTKIKKCQPCFDKGSKCSKCGESGHRPRNCKKTTQMKTRDQESGSDNESETEDKSRITLTIPYTT